MSPDNKDNNDKESKASEDITTKQSNSQPENINLDGSSPHPKPSSSSSPLSSSTQANANKTKKSKSKSKAKATEGESDGSNAAANGSSSGDGVGGQLNAGQLEAVLKNNPALKSELADLDEGKLREVMKKMNMEDLLTGTVGKIYLF